MMGRVAAGGRAESRWQVKTGRLTAVKYTLELQAESGDCFPRE